MKRRDKAFVRSAVIGVFLALAVASTAFAQGRGGGGPPPGGGGPGGPGGGGGMGGPPFPGNGPGSGPGQMGNVPPQSGQRGPAGEGPPRPGLQLGPPGRWWDDKSIIKNLKLRPDQQAHMDAIFDQNRNVLLAHLENVHQAEAQMEEISKSPAPDESALFAQIDHVAQARAELDKANTHMLLQIRKEMDADQIKRLEKATPR